GSSTLVAAVAAGVPTVCLRRVEPRVEQWMRAEAFARLGLIQLCHPRQLETGCLREKIESALAVPRRILKNRASTTLDFNGARNAAGHLLSLAKTAAIARTSEQRVASSVPEILTR